MNTTPKEAEQDMEMTRFKMPEKEMPAEQLILFFKEQVNVFLASKALEDLLKILQTDLKNLSTMYDGRLREDGSVVETQVVKDRDDLEPFREKLYPLFDELGFFRINKPLHTENSRILILGGSLNTCFERSEYAKSFINSSVHCVEGLACYRPIHPVERENTIYYSYADTEFGVLSDALLQVLDRSGELYEDDFRTNRNINSISCIRTFTGHEDDCSLRVFAAPSAEPHLRRADTADTIRFYLANTQFQPRESLLFITDNRYCNRQFLQILNAMLACRCVIPFDIIGCTPDHFIVKKETYSLFQFIQDLISTIDLIGRFQAEYC